MPTLHISVLNTLVPKSLEPNNVLNQERDIITHVILKTNKTRHKIKYFCLFENFQCFWIKKKKKQPKKIKQPKTKRKHVHN